MCSSGSVRSVWHCLFGVLCEWVLCELSNLLYAYTAYMCVCVGARVFGARVCATFPNYEFDMISFHSSSLHLIIMHIVPKAKVFLDRARRLLCTGFDCVASGTPGTVRHSFSAKVNNMNSN